jgi:hypothetical protein
MVLIFPEVSGLLVVAEVVEIILEALLMEVLVVTVQQLELHMLVLVMDHHLQILLLLEMVFQLWKILDLEEVVLVEPQDLLCLQVVVQVVPVSFSSHTHHKYLKNHNGIHKDTWTWYCNGHKRSGWYHYC